MAKINAKHDDTTIPLKVNADLTGSSIRVICTSRATGVSVDLPFIVIDAARGVLEAFTEDLVVGAYNLEVELTHGAGPELRRYTFPTKGYTLLLIGQDLG